MPAVQSEERLTLREDGEPFDIPVERGGGRAFDRNKTTANKRWLLPLISL